jgi:hypothetical protein
MAAQAWKVFNQAKRNLGRGVINLSGAASTHYCTLFKSSTSTTITTNVSVLSSLGAFTCAGSLDSIHEMGTVTWTGQNSANDPIRVWDAADFTFTASGASISAIRYAVIWQSTSAGGGPLIAYSSLSSAAFDIDTGNTLTVQIAAGGIFTLT